MSCCNSKDDITEVIGSSLVCPLSNLCCLALQTLKALRQIEVINFGDCLVRSKGAVAIADAVKEGLHKLKVLSSCC